jgi:hypothetical protein
MQEEGGVKGATSSSKRHATLLAYHLPLFRGIVVGEVPVAYSG